MGHPGRRIYTPSMGYHSSYDLMVFEPDAAPNEYVDFLAWFAEQMACGEDHGYDNPAETSEQLRAWLRDMVKVFPSGADPFFEDEPVGLEEDSYSGYSIGRQMIYATFVTGEIARATAIDLAGRHGLGVFEPSSEAHELWRPEAGRLVLTHRQEDEAQGAPSLGQRLTRKSNGTHLLKPRLPEWMS